LGGAAPATAAILPGVTVDGPANLRFTTTADVDVAPDNSAALVYLKTENAALHPFIARFVDGAWGTPQRVDTDSSNAASGARIAVANGGKLVVSYISGGNAVARISSGPGSPFGAELLLKSGGDDAYVDLSPNGNGYAVIVDNFDIFAQRLEGTTWSPVSSGALDATQANQAGDGNRVPDVAASADGASGAIAWGEETVLGSEGDVYVRRLTGTNASNALPTALAAGSLPGSELSSGKIADQPALDMDAGGTAWVVFRQNFEYGAGQQKPRAIARPITGETVGPGQVVDNMGNAPTEGRDFQQIDVNGAGAGLLSHHGNGTANDLEWASLAGGTWTPNGFVANENGSVPQAIPALGENGSGLIAYAFKSGTGANTAVARTTFGGLGPQTELSNPAFGALLSSVDASAGSGAFAVAAFIQQSGGDATTNRVVAAVVDLPQPPGGGPGGGGGNPSPDLIAPDVTGLALSRTRFRLGSALPKVAAVKTGTVIRFRVSEAATVRLRFTRILPGRRVAGACRKPTRLNRSRPRCKRLVPVRRSVSRLVQPGSRRIRFAGRLTRRQSLKPGSYRMTLIARDAAGNVSTPDRARFTLLPRKRR